jgi:hypothetical protein
VIATITSAVGIPLFMASIHSGGPALWLSAVLVPPLFLDIAGYLKVEHFVVWLLTIGVLQVLLVLSLVYGITAVTRAATTVGPSPK